MEREKLLIKISRILGKLNIPYLITGGIAVAIWGRVRSTFDIDIVVEIKEPKIFLLTQALKKLSKTGYISEEAAKNAIRTKSEFNFIDSNTGLKVDFWIKKDELFFINEFKRKIALTIGGEKIYFISPEDLILNKLLWHKQNNSFREIEDIQSILKISKGKIDQKYIEKWAEKQSTIKIFNKLLKS